MDVLERENQELKESSFVHQSLWYGNQNAMIEYASETCQSSPEPATREHQTRDGSANQIKIKLKLKIEILKTNYPKIGLIKVYFIFFVLVL